MNALLALGFGAPAALLALLALPALIWLLRLTPPRPKTVDFPPTALMRDLENREETPARTPWWLLLLRVAVVACLALALARPVLNPGGDDDGGSGPLWLLVDDGWPAAAHWEETVARLSRRLDSAEARGRPVVLIGLAGEADQTFAPQSVEAARRRLAVAEPHPWAETRAALLPALARSAETDPPGSVVWIAHGADLAPAAETRAFLDGLAKAAKDAPIAVSLPGRVDAIAVDRLDNGAEAITAGLLRAETGGVEEGRLAALDRKGRRLAEVPWRFEAGAPRAEVRFELPLDLRNDVARVEIVDRPGAGATRLVDDRWRRRTVGLVTGTGFDRDQPLLAPTHYLDAALAPISERRLPKATEIGAGIRELIDHGLSVLVLADVGAVPPDAAAALAAWVEKGGILLRFAGPRLAAAATDDPLLPVGLRRGERALGGALSWASPRGLGPFPKTGPFVDLTAPAEVRVTRQILAEPGPELAERTWAALTDGTPVVTAVPRGRGRIVLFHVGADTAWSDLPLSGVFPQMLRRIVALAGAPATAPADAAATEAGTSAPVTTAPAAIDHATLPPWRLLDGFGRLGPPGPEARPIAAAAIAGTRPDRRHPPGLWGRGEALAALQPITTDATLEPIEPRLTEAKVTLLARAGADATPLAPGFLVAAIVAALIDAILRLAPAWWRRRPRPGLAASLVVAAALGLLALAPSPAHAAEAPPIDEKAKAAALAPRLAWIETGDATLDDVARRGLLGLSRALADRTSFEPADPVGVDPASDDLTVYPLLYWPVAPDAAASPRALARVDAYMRSGGTVVFDTRDADEAEALRGTGRSTPAGAALRRLLAGLDLPELEPVPPDHVLGRTFYLLQAFPGRFDGRLWVEAAGAEPRDDLAPSAPAQAAPAPDGAPGERSAPARPVRAADGVSPILVTGNDLVGAWARTDGDDDLLPMASADPRGREMALRTGINLVMYVLTGNYKADQVHIPALLERLGR